MGFDAQPPGNPFQTGGQACQTSRFLSSGRASGCSPIEVCLDGRRTNVGFLVPILTLDAGVGREGMHGISLTFLGRSRASGRRIRALHLCNACTSGACHRIGTCDVVRTRRGNSYVRREVGETRTFCVYRCHMPGRSCCARRGCRPQGYHRVPSCSKPWAQRIMASNASVLDRTAGAWSGLSRREYVRMGGVQYMQW